MSYRFMVHAVIVGLFVSICAALLGVSLVLKRYSMIGEGLSNVGFGALAVALAFNLAPLKVSIPVVVLAAFLLLKISESSKIKGDAAIAIISTASLAGGVMVVSLTTGISTDVCNFMFGSILAMRTSDVYLSIVLSLMVLILFILFYNKIFAVTFDETFARATGTKADWYNMLIALLTAITIVLGMRMMGALLISSLIIFPALSSMRVFKNFRAVVISSAIISVVCFLSGITISYLYATPAGASVVMIDLLVFALFFVVGKMGGKPMKKTMIKSIGGILLLSGMLFLAGCSESDSAENVVNESEPVKQEQQQPSDNEKQSEGQPGDASKEDPKKEPEQDKKELDRKNAQAAQEIPKGTIPGKTEKASEKKGDELYIREKMFITQINDIFYNISDYEGKTIAVEGMFRIFPGLDGEPDIPVVFRNGPGCCGNDGWAGFLLHYDGEYPEIDDWILVKGTPEIVQTELYMQLYLNVISLEVKQERGAEFVDQ